MEEVKEKKTIKIIGRIISRIIYAAIALFLVFEAVIGVINMDRLNRDEDPVWYFSTKEENTKFKSETTYNLGLYKIVKTKEGLERRLTLKPFFLK